MQRGKRVVPPAREEIEQYVRGLKLAGEPLELPCFHETGWRVNQHFSPKDDPDRVREPWSPPGFLRLKDPMQQRAKTTADELDISRACGANGSSFARVVHGVLDEEDCAALSTCVNAKGFTPALINVGGGSQMLVPEARDGHRVIVDCPSLSSWLLEVVRPHLPKELCGGMLIDLNERSRFLCYTPGQYFAPHHDGRYTRPTSHKNEGDYSAITLQVYLHDVPRGNGGGTTFLDGDEKPVSVCQPGVGDVLVFTQDLYHEGSELDAGLKYTLRTEAMYRKQPVPRGTR